MITEPQIAAIIDRIIEREGGARYTNRAEDRGGPTKFGITMAALQNYRKRPVSDNDVATLGEVEARAIYRSVYLEGPGFGVIEHAGLLDLVVDSAVQHGPMKAIKLLQEALRVQVDGQFGPVTKKVLQHSWAPTVYRELLAARIQLYGRIITKIVDDKDRDGITDAAENASGWMNRMAEFVRGVPT